MNKYLKRYRGEVDEPVAAEVADNRPIIDMDAADWADLPNDMKWLKVQPLTRHLEHGLWAIKQSRSKKELAELEKLKNDRRELLARIRAERTGQKAKKD